ncbi:MAG: RNA polymerase sigma-70 factor (ECF subfamily) [Gammaproteobacteria bacterium]
MATAALKLVHSRNDETKGSESVASVTDQQLVERVQNGDNKAFDLLVRKYQHKVVSLVSRYVNDHAEALDISQEAFIKAWRALPNFRGDSQFYTWIYRIAVNTAKNYLVSRGRRPTAYASDVDDQEDQMLQGKMKDVDTPEALALTDEIRDTVLAAIDALPEDLRTAIVLREIEGMSYDEIADVMECPIGTVRSRLFRAREAIDTQIKPLMG